MRLSELRDQVPAVVASVEDAAPVDPVARRLRELGFVRGEVVRIVARGPIKADPVLVQVGFTRFALRKAEADRVMVEPRAA
jgi:ferrous iron transport protein A